MYQDDRGFFHQDQAGESIVCAAANAMTVQKMRGENQAFVIQPDYTTALKESPLNHDYYDAITKKIQKLLDGNRGDTKAVVLPESPATPPDHGARPLYTDEPLAEPLRPLELLPISPCRHDGHRPTRPEWPAPPESLGSPWPAGPSAPPAPDPVNHPAHYTSSEARCRQCGHPIECIDVIEHLPCCTANTIKYLWRCDLKHESPLEDLRKARWYLDREIERRTRQEADQQRGGGQ